MKHTINYVALFIVLLGCQNGFCQKESTSQLVNPFDNKVWFSELEKDTAEMKASWLTVFGSSFRYNTDGGLNIFQEGDDPSTMNVIPVLNYVIRYQSLMNWNEKEPIEKLLELSKDTTTCFLIDNNNIKCYINFKRKENHWVASMYSRFDKETTDIMNAVYFEKKESVIYINVEISDGENSSQFISTVYKEKGNYMTLRKYDTDSPLFINSLINIRQRLKSLDPGDFF